MVQPASWRLLKCRFRMRVYMINVYTHIPDVDGHIRRLDLQNRFVVRMRDNE